MKVLFLEDDHNRIAKARREFVGSDLTVAETAQSAIAALDANRFDLVSLDHDLGGTVMAESDGNSGYAVARHIAAMEAPPVFVIIHSFNPVGAQRMEDCLIECEALRARLLFDTPKYWQFVEVVKESRKHDRTK